jgi:hypothetical protein
MKFDVEMAEGVSPATVAASLTRLGEHARCFAGVATLIELAEWHERKGEWGRAANCWLAAHAIHSRG